MATVKIKFRPSSVDEVESYEELVELLDKAIV